MAGLICIFIIRSCQSLSRTVSLNIHNLKQSADHRWDEFFLKANVQHVLMQPLNILSHRKRCSSPGVFIFRQQSSAKMTFLNQHSEKQNKSSLNNLTVRLQKVKRCQIYLFSPPSSLKNADLIFFLCLSGQEADGQMNASSRFIVNNKPDLQTADSILE